MDIPEKLKQIHKRLIVEAGITKPKVTQNIHKLSKANT